MAPLGLSLNQLVANNAGILAKLLGADKSLNLDLAATTDHMRVESAQLQHVLLNLTLNARDAMAAGGRLTLQSANHSEAPNGHARHDDTPPGRYLKLCVVDDGRGMDTATQAQLFEPFFTTKPHSEGTGLGLALVYGVVQQSGGFIRVSSILGVGSCFEVLLPEVTEEVSPNLTSLGPLPSTRGKETLLLVEADLVVAKRVSGILTSEGYTVLTVARAAAAKALLSRQGKPIQLLIGDLNTPEGAKLAQTLYASQPALRLIATDATPTAALAGILPHHHRYLAKPYALSTLLQTVRAVLDVDEPHQPTPPPKG